MLQVFLPANWQAERQYVASVMLQDWLGIPVEFCISETLYSVEIKLENGNWLCLEDHFFKHFDEENQTYLRRENMPESPIFLSKNENPFLPEKDMPLLFGNNNLEVSDHKIICGADLFASSYFMLTRWEEYVLTDRDEHDRFPAKASFAGKYGLLHRPIVNEYLEFLWAMLTHLGIRHERKKRQFEFMLTCDVDMALLWRSPLFFLKKTGGDLLKRLDFQAVAFDLRSFIQTYILGKKDPFDTFDYLMDCAERMGKKAHFFFLSGGNSKYDQALPLSSPFVKRLIERIKSRNHDIGIHPSYFSNRPVSTESVDRSSPAFQEEKISLENAADISILTNRQHFLRFEAPATWQLLEDNDMTWDSTLYFPEQPGFRCGACLPYPVFNFLTRKKLRLLEIPLTAMEVSWVIYSKSPPEKMLAELKNLMVCVKKYDGCFVLLWHNSSFNVPEYLPYLPVFEEFMKEVKIRVQSC